MKQALIDVLETICPGNVFLQGTVAEDYPESFVTFWTNDTVDADFMDNEATSTDWFFSVIFYSSDPALVNSKPAEIRAALKAADFIPQGKGNDIPSDKPTHTGWAMEFIKKKYKKEKKT